MRFGRAVKLGEGKPQEPPDAWISGPFSAWLSAVLDGRLRALNRDGKDGDRELAKAIAIELHAELSGYRANAAG